MKTWSTRPSKEDVVAEAKAFFATLTAGRIEEAEASVAHAYEDWNENVFNLFQDHVLVHTTPKDATFEGGGWKTDRAWLADFRLEGEGEWMGKHQNVLWLDIAYRGERSGHIAELQLIEQDGVWRLQHDAFRMA